jgi:hypothetical protein
MHGPMAVPLAVCLGACLLAAGGCAGWSRQAARSPANVAAPQPIPVAQPSPPAVPTGQSAGAAGAPAQSAGGSTAQATTPPDAVAAAASPGAAAAAAATGGPTSPAAASAPASATAASAATTNAAMANAPGPVSPGAPPAPVASASASVAAASAPAPAVASAPSTGADEAAPATSASLAPPAPAPAAAAVATRVMLADELPYGPAHLRARDARVEHHHSKEGSRDAREAGKRPYHPAPGIVVDVVDAQGGASAPALQRTARNLGYWPFRQCYEDGLRRDQHLGGKVSLELAVSPSGAVDRSVVTGTTVRDEIVAACVAREAQHLALPSSESPTTARVDVSLAVGDEPVATGRPVPNAEPIRQSLRGSWSAARRCYASKLTSHPGIGGRMELHFHVRHGEIVEVDEASAGESGGHFGDPDVTRCVLGVYRTARLPAPHGARERSFVYALQFESAPVADAAR